MADPVKADEKSNEEVIPTKAQERIKELDRRNKELERLVNMSKRIDQVEDVVRAGNQRKEPEAKVDDGGWGTFLDPKVAPLIEKYVAPLKQAIFQLADENDELKVTIKEPKYANPEVRETVAQARRDRQRQTGILEPRENIITFLKGQKSELFKDDEEAKAARREEAEGVHVETIAGAGGPRAATRQESGLTTNSTVEEMEKWFSEHPEDAKV